MKAMKIKMLPIAIWCLAVAAAIPALATAAVERYVIDTEGGHAFVQFRVKHLAYSWLYGRFNDFSGTFTYDTEDTSNSKVEVTIDTASLDSNHAERDKHLRGKDFLEVDRYPQASFKSTAYKETGFNTSVLEGELTLKGITKPITIEVQRIGNGPDPWGGYRRGYQGSTSFALKDFGIDYNLGPAAREVEMILSIEGVRQ
ncbi:Polyisoprenoid-binding protein YceI [Thiocapsa roseopersicina]|uniref:Polyisoprenoid-binding protein YceI n=2 Tax=Thiocapsa roseopersicina TaxID=1058 RepID=A0A1H2S6F6_THIRO|nr:Polyisoprenoid-binding protein YceI [Thiocapsa roseopersicina]